MLEKTIKEANKICSYFGGNIIGSVLIKDHIDVNLINDVDIAIQENVYFQVQQYLYDNGFEETKKGYKQKGYEDFIGSGVFKKEGFLPIHLCFKTHNFVVYDADTIWAEKIKRYSKSDVAQIKSLLSLNESCPWKSKENI